MIAPALSKDLRSRLERTVRAARQTAEAGARAALDRLATGEARPFDHLAPDERALRTDLRARARALGDRRDPATNAQAIDRLVQEVAYEHWHTLLFARFLAARNVLMHPDIGAAVSIEDCAELAAEEGAPDAYALAARYAARMLPALFRPDDPALRVPLAPEHRRALVRLVEDLAPETFGAWDSLGWVYQFWQADAKDAANKSGRKIDGETLPAVTQLFTEGYMVDTLLHNTVGAWWAARHPGEPLPAAMPYLRRLPETQPGEQGLLSGERADPSSERAVASDERAVPFGERGGPSSEEGIAFGERVGPSDERDSLSGERVVASGGKSVVFGERGSPSDGKDFASDEKGVAADGRAVVADGAGHTGAPAAGAFEGWPDRAADLRILDPSCGSGHVLVAALHLLVPLRRAEGNLDVREAVDAVLRDSLHGLELDPRCTQIAAFNLALAAWTYPGAGGYRPLPRLNVACVGLAPTASKTEWRRLAGGDTRLAQALDRLHVAFQNAPTLGSLVEVRSGEHDLGLDTFSDDLVRLVRSLERHRPAAAPGTEAADDEAAEGVVAEGLADAARILAQSYHLVVTNVPYLARGKQGETLRAFCAGRYPAAKADLATVFVERCLSLCARGGTAAVVTPQNWLFLGSYAAFREALLKEHTLNAVLPLGPRAFETITGEVVNVGLFVVTKRRPADGHAFFGLDASEGKTPEAKADALRTAPVRTAAQSAQRDNPDARITLDEVEDLPLLEKYASSLQGIATGDDPQFKIYFWEPEPSNRDWKGIAGTTDETHPFKGRERVLFWEDGEGRFKNFAMVLRQEGRSVGWNSGKSVWGKTGVSVSQMGGLPSCLFTGDLFDHSAASIIPHDPEHLAAIWCFCSSDEFGPAVRSIDQALKVTNASLVKVPFDLDRWMRVAEERYPNGLPEPHSDDPTQWLFEGDVASSTDPLQVAVARLVGYRWPAQVDKDSGAPIPDALDAFADDDGIVPLVEVRGEPSAESRLRALLAAAYGADFTAARLDALLAPDGYAQKGLGAWLRDGFFAAHVKRFQNRPFVWHVWDGRKDGFGALVHYHRLDRAALEKLAYGYLGDWIAQQDRDAAADVPGADARLVAARDLQRRLALILEGEPPHDVFVRWKPAHEQPIGWAPDLNDGVRLNIRPFVTAGVLRAKVNVKWEKDRGTNPEGAPWGPERHNRYEDLPEAHKLRGEAGQAFPSLTLAARRYARRTRGLDA